MNHNFSNLDCNSVEQILFETSINALTEMEQSQILSHIKSCENCKSSEKLLNSLDQLLRAELVDSKVNPNPHIKKSLINRLKSKNESKNPIVDIIRNFFDLRIPLYQVITVLLLIGAFSIFINKKSKSLESFNNNVSIIAAVDSNTISMSFQNSIEWIDNHNKGKSILEDSVLASFIQSAM